jgi:hypothetical protein
MSDRLAGKVAMETGPSKETGADHVVAGITRKGGKAVAAGGDVWNSR